MENSWDTDAAPALMALMIDDKADVGSLPASLTHALGLQDDVFFSSKDFGNMLANFVHTGQF